MKDEGEDHNKPNDDSYHQQHLNADLYQIQNARNADYLADDLMLNKYSSLENGEVRDDEFDDYGDGPAGDDD